MPNHDGTGPFGDGRPGRGLGPCGLTDKAQPNALRRGLGRGMRNCFGRRRGMQNSQILSGSTAYEYDRESLQNEKQRLEKLLDWISDRLADFTK